MSSKTASQQFFTAPPRPARIRRIATVEPVPQREATPNTGAKAEPDKDRKA